MEGTVQTGLRRKGVDVEFLCWLEGSPDRLPCRWQLFRLKESELLKALFASVYLRQFFADPNAVPPDRASTWEARYRVLQAFLVGAIKHRAAGRLSKQVPPDLAALEKVLGALLPADAWSPYRRDIQSLRRQGIPQVFPKVKPPRRGGKRPSEETERMRAAIEYLKDQSKTPYRDLADLWNEHLGEPRYHADEMQSRLRKGPQWGNQALEFWQGIYEGVHWLAFPARCFPYSSKAPVPPGKDRLFDWPPADSNDSGSQS